MRILLMSLMVAASLLRAEGEQNGDIRMPDIVLDAIKHCECLKEKGQCVPHVIRINAPEEAERAKMAGFDVNGHLIRCGTTEQCTAQAQALIQGGIVNLDLGPYQINYKYHPNPLVHEFFEEHTAREKANTILTRLVKSFGYSWETLGRYHHAPTSDAARNARYYRKMYAYIYANTPTEQGSN